MNAVTISPLTDNLPFGARVSGLTWDNIHDEDVRRQIAQLFEDKGVIVFDDIEPSDEMQVAVSEIFGPLKEHPVKKLKRVDPNKMPGVVEIGQPKDTGGIIEIDGERLSHWLPWHFDHCYHDELNRAGVLRATEISPTGGITGFVDGIALYDAFPRELRDRMDDALIAYTLNTAYETNNFGLPESFKIIREKPGALDMVAEFASKPRAIHPAVWTRATGEKVLHVSQYMAAGILENETPEGEELLEEVCQTINQIAPSMSYHHSWKPTEMLIWDNWRMLHAVSGNDPSLGRTMQRTTIKGDYGLGYFEGGANAGEAVDAMA